MANPALNEKTLRDLSLTGARAGSAVMTTNGTVNKVGILVVLTALSGAWAWSNAESSIAAPLAIGSILANLVLTFVIIYNKQKSAYLAPAYALLEGLALGFIAYYADKGAPGIAVHAFIGTFSILFAMVALYHLRILQATPRFMKIVLGATFGIVGIYLLDIVLMMFGTRVPMIHEGGVYGILFSVVVVIVASMNFIIDFAMIEQAANARAPKYMEWYGGFAVLLTLVWVYLEILRLLGKARR